MKWKWSFRKLMCEQLKQQLKPFDNITIPAEGWIKTIRQAMGMTALQLAKRSNLSRPRILRIEKDETLKHVTLSTLEKVAEGLSCRVVYALVPQKDLLTAIDEQAEQYITNQLQSISHSMLLEDQQVADHMQKKQKEMLKEEVLKNNIKDIWQ
jgi:predicted DNA-binding mobile mystery protein A